MTTATRTTRAGTAGGGSDFGRARGGAPRRLAAVAVVVLLCLAPAAAVAQSVSDGFAAYKQGDYQRARDIWRPLAEAGNAVAQFNLGKLFEFGGGEVRQDYSLAARWYREAAAQGITAAQNNLGLMYSQGLGVPRDPRRAAELWKRAAEEDYSLAQYNLALAYFRGEGVGRDERLAAVWFEKAAQAGLPDAQYAMGQLLRVGRVAARDERQALTWYKLAAAQGHADAAAQADSLQGRGVVAKEPAPLEPAPAVAAAPPEPAAEQPAVPEAPSTEAAVDLEPAEGRETTAREGSAGAGVAGEVPVPQPKPEPPGATAADTSPRQTAALPAPGTDEAPAAAQSQPSGEPATAPATEYRLWLISANSAAAAEDLRNQTLARHADTLGGVDLDIYEMDYGERGHFYRVLAGPLYSADAANDLCRRLRADDPQGFCKVLTR